MQLFPVSLQPLSAATSLRCNLSPLAALLSPSPHLVCIVTNPRPILLQSMEVIVPHKLGMIPVPEKFINLSDEAKEMAKKLAQETPATKTAQKPAAAKQPAAAKRADAKQKTKKEAAADKVAAAKQAKAVHAAPVKEATLVRVWV